MREWLILERGTTYADALTLDAALLSLTPWGTERTTGLCQWRPSTDGRMLMALPPMDVKMRPDVTEADIDAVARLFDDHVTQPTREDQRTILDLGRGARRPLRAFFASEIRQAVRREDVLITAGILQNEQP